MVKIKCLMIWGGALDYSGVPNVIKSIIYNLNYKVDFTLIISNAEHPALDDFLKLGVKIKYIDDSKPARCPARLWYYLFRIPSLQHQVAKHVNEDYDCVYCMSGPLSGVYLKTAKKRNIKTRIVHCHGKLMENVSMLRKIQLFYLKHKIEKYATCKCTCSTEAGKTFFLDFSDMITVVNGIDLGLYPSMEKVQSERIRLLQIGYFSEVKNQRFSIKVLQELTARGIDVACAFIGYIGDQQYYNNLLTDIRDCGLEDNVEFLPADTNKNEIFANSDILMLPSISEACPLVALEAQATYTSVCASNGGPTDVDFGLCEFVNGWEVKTWANKIIEMKNKKYIRNENFHDIDASAYAERIYEFMVDA